MKNIGKGVMTINQRIGIGKVLTFLLLFLYIAGTSEIHLLHSFLHDHDASAVHSEEHEQDPCHRLIHHNDTEQGCGHNSHLIVSDKCQMCDIFYHADQSLLSETEFASEDFTSEYFDSYKPNLDSYWSVISSSRAPPALV